MFHPSTSSPDLNPPTPPPPQLHLLYPHPPPPYFIVLITRAPHAAKTTPRHLAALKLSHSIPTKTSQEPSPDVAKTQTRETQTSKQPTNHLLNRTLNSETKQPQHPQTRTPTSPNPGPAPTSYLPCLHVINGPSSFPSGPCGLPGTVWVWWAL